MQALYAQLLVGLINGSFYALLSLGLAVIFGMLNIINFAHGALYMMGAFCAYFLLSVMNIGYWPALIIAPIAVGIFGMILERTMLQWLSGLDHLYGLLLTFGMALIIQGVFQNYFGSSGLPYAIPDELKGGMNLGFMFLPIYRGWVIVFSAAVCFSTWFLIEKTRLGAYLRAATENPTLVRAQANLSLETYRHDVTPSHQQKTPAGAHITLGRALRQKGYFQEALREYERAIEGGEANAEVLQAMLELYLLQRDTGAAIATAERFAREFSPTAKTWNGRGVALQLEGRHAEAEQSYMKALEIDPSYPFSHNNLGVLFWHKSDTKSAINSFRRALQAPAPPVEARLNLALGLFRRKHTELALEAYRQVLSAAPAQTRSAHRRTSRARRG